MSAAASETRKAITSATSSGARDMDQVGAVLHGTTHLRRDPSRVGHGRVDDVRRDAVRSELERGRHREVLERGLGGAVGDLLREAERPSRRETDDPSPRAAACEVAPRELRDQERAGASVDREHAIDRLRRDPPLLATEAVGRPRRERVADPGARVVDEDVDRAEGGLGLVEEAGGRVRVREIDLDRRRASAGAADPRLGITGVRMRIGPEPAQQDVGAVDAEGVRGRRADPVVRARHQGDVAPQLVPFHRISGAQRTGRGGRFRAS